MKKPPTDSNFEFALQPLRPLPRFGRRQPIQLSTAVSFDPNTIITAATGHSLNHILEKMDYGAYRAMLAWIRSHDQGSSMQRGTRAALEKLQQPADDINRFRFEELLAAPNALNGYWRILFRTFRRGAGPTWRGLLVRLAWQDRQLHVLSRKDPLEQSQWRERMFISSVRYWHSTGILRNSFRPMLVLDMTLQHLAWADVQLSRSKYEILKTDPVVGLLCPGRVPMRRWFDRLLLLTGKTNLSQLCDLLAVRADVDSTRMFTHLELKQWATAAKLVPPGVAIALLTACGADVDMHRERAQLWIARLLTFLVSFVQAFSAQTIPAASAQSALYERILQLREGFAGERKLSDGR